MKILHITNNFSEGGVDTLLLSLLPKLQENYNNVELLVLDRTKISLVPALEKLGVKVHKGKYANIRNPLNIFFIWQYLKKDYDIIHVHLFPTQYFVAIAKLISFSKIIFITTEHSSTNRRRKNKIFKILDTLVYKCYHKITCVSEAVKDNLDAWANTQNKTEVIYNGIDLSKFTTAEPYNKKELNLPEDSQVIIMIARFFNQKDHKTVIRIMKNLAQNVHLLFCGSGEKEFNECVELSKALNVENRIHFLGNRTDIPRLIQSSDIGILSTFYEGFGLSLLECMAAGKPVLASDVDGVRELVGNAGILFEAQNETQLSEKILLLLKNKNSYKEIAQKCYERSLKFSEDKMIENYLKLYNKCHKN